MSSRYEAVQIDDRWYVIDHKHPEKIGCKMPNKKEAETNARTWNLLVDYRAS